MTLISPSNPVEAPVKPALGRLDYLDATRAFALILGVVFHASMSFMPIFLGWAVQDISTSSLVGVFVLVSHAFRMETFFLLAGFFSQMTLHRKGTADFIRSRALRLLVPFVAGWFLLRPLLISGWIMGNASLRGTVDIWAALRGGFQSLSTLPAGIFTGTHLWFLYYLAIVTALTLVGRGLLAATRKLAVLRLGDQLIAWLGAVPGGLWLLALPTAGVLWFMSGWGMDTPDRSLSPHFPVLAIYGGFFVFGWMLGRQRELIASFARFTPLRCLQAIAGIAVILFLAGIERDPAHPHYLAVHLVYAFGYASTMWSLVFLTVGVFQQICRRPNAAIRYIADSSYWMYLIHLPVVIWLQVAVAEVEWHWSLKLTLVSAAAIAISLITYDFFVRSTFVGWVMNGRRRDRVIAPFLFGTLLGRTKSSTVRPELKP